MPSPTMGQPMSEQEMDQVLEECGLLEEGMTASEKRVLIQTLELSKISAQTEENFRLKDDEITVLPSSPFLQRRVSSAAGANFCPSPADEPSPLIGGAQPAQRRRPLRLPTSPDRAPRTDGHQIQIWPSDGREQSSQSPDDHRQPSTSADGHQQSANGRRQPPRSANSHQQPPLSENSREQPHRSTHDEKQPSRSADSPDQAGYRSDGSEDWALPADQPAAFDSGSEDGAPLAGDTPPLQPAASPPRPVLHYVNHEGRRERAERSERTEQLLKLLSDTRSMEDNVRCLLKHMESGPEGALDNAEDAPWSDDIQPSRGFQESSLPPPLDAARLVYRLRPAAEPSRRSAALKPSMAPIPEFGAALSPRPKPESSSAPRPEPSSTPSPEPSTPLRPEPAELGGLHATAAGRQHSRANQLLQRAIRTHSAKKPSLAPKLSLKLSSQQQTAASAVSVREPTARPGTSGGSRSDGAAPLLPPLSSRATHEERPAAETPAGRRRAASPPAGAASSAKQARRRPSSSDEIRPAPLRLPRRRRPGQSMVPLVTRVQTPGDRPRHLQAAMSSSSDEDSVPAVVAGSRPAPAVRPGPSATGTPSSIAAGTPSVAASGTPSRTGPGIPSGVAAGNRFGAAAGIPSGATVGTSSRAVPGTSSGAAPGTLSGASAGETSSGAGAPSAASGAAGDATAEQKIQCPLCAAFFSKETIEAHASRCEGDDVMEIEESPSPPLRRATTTTARTTRERTPPGRQRCQLCSELLEEGAVYLGHVDECVRRRQQNAGGDVDPAPEHDRWLTNGASSGRGEHGRPANTSGPSAGSSFSPKFQRISAQTNSCIDYHNQFPVASGAGGGTGRRRGARGRGRHTGRTRGRARGKGRRS